MAMQVWQVTAYGADDNPGNTISKLVIKTDVPISTAKDGQVIIKVEWCYIVYSHIRQIRLQNYSTYLKFMMKQIFACIILCVNASSIETRFQIV